MFRRLVVFLGLVIVGSLGAGVVRAHDEVSLNVPGDVDGDGHPDVMACDEDELRGNSGQCVKQPPICGADEQLVGDICIKELKLSPFCGVGEIAVGDHCEKLPPLCALGEIAVGDHCEKLPPLCAVGEVIVGGTCVKAR